MPDGAENALPWPPENRHIADQPTWDCRVCGEPWPCNPAKGHLMIEYRGWPTSLGLYLAIQWHEASRDLKGNDADEELWSRFLGWHRGARTSWERHQQGPVEILKMPDR